MGNEGLEKCYDFDIETGQGMKEIDNEAQEETKQENEFRIRSLIRGNQ